MGKRHLIKFSTAILFVIAMILGVNNHNYEAKAFSNDYLQLRSGNHIFFYNMEGRNGSSDFILLESDGRWGLIDSGHRYETTITDENGTVWRTDVSNLSCQDQGKNGRDAMMYMIETLGVDHLDFIIATHSHSDHIGGIPEIADILVDSADGTDHLIDENTVYFYKTYHHTGAQDDDLGDSTIQYSWHSQAFFYQALNAVTRYGGSLVDVSCGIQTQEGNIIDADQSRNLSLMEEVGVFDEISYESRSETNPFDDRISFQWGDMTMDLYHLFAVEGAVNENVNSLAVVISCGDHKVFMAGDMDTQFQVEQKLAREIAADHGTIDIVKMSHHGIFDGSNSREFIDCLQPGIMISTNHWNDITQPTITGVYSSLKYYAAKHYGTVIYGAGISDKMLALDLDEEEAGVYNVAGTGETLELLPGESCLDAGLVQDGWSEWSVEIRTNNIKDWLYFIENEAVTGWNLIDSKWYYFDQDGFVQHGWFEEAGYIYYLDNDMQIGWKYIDDEWYYFYSDGILKTNGWIKDSKGWCWADADGKLVKDNWIRSKDSWYYLGTDGYMAAGKWLMHNGDWYCLHADGSMAANEWARDSKGWCWLNSSGKQVKDKWVKDREDWYYVKSNGYMSANEWARDSKGWCYMNGAGKMVKNKWVQYNNKWYYLEKNGYMVTGEYIIEGKKYQFDQTGVWLK